jgi:hypothetical protein
MATKFRKLIKECVTQVLREELEAPLYVEYVSQRAGEQPFIIGGQKFEYVNAKYPDGKVDIGVYAFSGDVVYAYDAFRKMHNITEGKVVDSKKCKYCGKPIGDKMYPSKFCSDDHYRLWVHDPSNKNEAFDPTSVGPNPEASEGIPNENPYAAWNNKMRQMEDMDHPIDDKTNLPSPHPADKTTKTSLPLGGEKKYLKQQPGGQMAAVNCNEGDGFDQFRKTIGTKKVNEFLSKFGLGPDYKPSKPKLHECPQCKKCNARYKEMHADTDMNEMVLECPDCGCSS